MNLLPSGHLTVSELDFYTTFYGKDMEKSMENYQLVLLYGKNPWKIRAMSAMFKLANWHCQRVCLPFPVEPRLLSELSDVPTESTSGDDQNQAGIGMTKL